MSQKILAIDVGGTYTKFAQVTADGTITGHDKIKTAGDLETLLARFDQIIAPHISDIQGIAISFPGKINLKTGVVHLGGALTYIKDLPLKTLLADKYGLPVTILNDGKAAVLAEHWLGKLQGIDNGAAIVLGTGIGGGLIVNGQVVNGAHYQGGELSFLLKSPTAGIHGHNMLVMDLSAVKLVHEIGTILNLENKGDGLAVFEAINQGNNEAVMEIFETYCLHVAYLMMNLQAVLDFERILIGGGISSQPILIKEVRKQYRQLKGSSDMFDRSLTDVEIDSCRFNNDSNLLGAVRHFLDSTAIEKA